VTITVDDAGSGDLLFGIVIGAFRDETQEFCYDVIDVKYFQTQFFRKKQYLDQANKIVHQLLGKLQPKPDEEIKLCQGYIFDVAEEELRKEYGDRVHRIKVVGEPQKLIEIAYCDEIRNLGYEPLPERDEKRAKNFYHMMNWLKQNPNRMKFAKTGWPRLARYPLFKPFHPRSQKTQKNRFSAVCSECGKSCNIPFKPKTTTKPIYCKECWETMRSRHDRSMISVVIPVATSNCKSEGHSNQ
jgi:CxxC-x17-CxxC domain-containing protein